MPHLIKPIVPEEDPIDIQICDEKVRAAHDYLAEHGAAAINRARDAQGSDTWGCDVKRVRVEFPASGCPGLVPESMRSHSLTEVYNQCATVERLLDALAWAADALAWAADALPGYGVAVCNPTTSGAGVVYNNDLVLKNPQTGEVARFEVSDVSSRRDSNRKEAKDLTSLGVMMERWPDARLFLVVSEEFAHRLRRRLLDAAGPAAAFYYVEVKGNGSTRIFEVRRGGVV